MNDNFFRTIKELAEESALSNNKAEVEKKIYEVTAKVVSALAFAMGRDYGEKSEKDVLSFNIDIKDRVKDSKLEIFETVEVVKKAANDSQITLKNAQKSYPDAEIGDTVKILVSPSKYNKYLDQALNNAVFFISAGKIAALKGIDVNFLFNQIENGAAEGKYGNYVLKRVA